MSKVLTVICLAVGLLGSAACRSRQGWEPVSDLWIPMSDGCLLQADLFLPGPGRHPVVLIMTPYGRQGMREIAEGLRQRGYAVVIQDVRGRYGSEGVFDPIRQEKRDGPSTVDWIVDQEWYDRDRGIAIMGACYQATAGLATAAQRQEVRAMVSLGGLASLHDLCYRGGARVIHHALPWTILMSASPQPRLSGTDWYSVFSTRPVSRAARVAGFESSLWEEWTLRSNREDPYWADLGVEEFLGDVGVPILHVSGWYDIDLGPALRLYEVMTSNNRDVQKLVLGPWSHRSIWTGDRALQDVDFGPEAECDIASLAADWFDRFLWEDREVEEERGHVRVFVTGANQWMELPSWPSGTPVDLYLEHASLTTVPSERGSSRCFISDPAEPVPTMGGNVWHFLLDGFEPGPADQSPLHGRPDVLVYSSETLTAPLVIAGPVSVEIWVESDAETGDFTGKLVDLAPDGTARYVADGISREFTYPGRVSKVTIDLWAAGHRFDAGHRVGLELAGSCFPKFDLNPNTIEGVPQPARQCIHTGSERLSRLRLWYPECSE